MAKLNQQRRLNDEIWLKYDLEIEAKIEDLEDRCPHDFRINEKGVHYCVICGYWEA